jgi:dTDP-glucose pyrophosphorylase
VTDAIITMGGFGRRFADAGYTIPKYRIVVHGRSLFSWSMLSLREFYKSGSRFIFVVRQDDEAPQFIRKEAEALGISDVKIAEILKPTDGQATTALAARDCLAHLGRPILIYNIDTFVDPRFVARDDVRGEGWIPCFRAEGTSWSFVRVNDELVVSEVREKKRISDLATVGLYWFSSFELYEDVYRRHYSSAANEEAGERYVAPIYNTLIKDGSEIIAHEIPGRAVVPLGTPLEVDQFRRIAPPVIAN